MQIGIKSHNKYLIALLWKKKIISKNSQISYENFIFLVKFQIYVTGCTIYDTLSSFLTIVITKTTACLNSREMSVFARYKSQKSIKSDTTTCKNCELHVKKFIFVGIGFFWKHDTLPIKRFHLLTILPMWLLKMLSLTHCYLFCYRKARATC